MVDKALEANKRRSEEKLKSIYFVLCYLWTLLKKWLLFERAYWAETYKCQYEPLVEKRNWYL